MLEVILSFVISNPAGLIGVLMGVMVAIIPILKDSAENNWKKRFREQVKNGVLNGNLKFEDMQHLQERWSQDRQSVLSGLRIMLAEAISAEDEKLRDKIDEIRSLIYGHNEREPFSELPENISLQLNSIREGLK